MKKWAIALLALLIASPLYAEEKTPSGPMGGGIPISLIPGQIIISTDLGAEWFTLGGGNGNCYIQVNGPGSASLICPNFGGGGGGHQVPGGPPQVIGYSTTDQNEAQTFVGDVTLQRTGPNTLTATVNSISSVLPGLQVAGPVAINGPLSVTGNTILNALTTTSINATTVTATTSINTSNMTISGVLNFGPSGNLYFNGFPMGGTCPDGQFVNFISGKGVPTCAEPPSGGAVTIVSPTPPPNPVEGLLWFNTLDLQTYIWYSDGTSSQWVAIVNLVPGGGGAPTNNPAFTGTATFQNITVSGNSIFNGPSTFNNTVAFNNTLTMPDGSTWTNTALTFNTNTTVNMPNLTNFPGGWTVWNWASPADNVPSYWDDTGIEQLYDVTAQYVTLPVPTASYTAPDFLEMLVQTNPDDAAHNYPWGQYTLQNMGAAQTPDAGNTQTWQAEGLEFINSIGIHGDTWGTSIPDCNIIDVSGSWLSDCAIAANASSLRNNINYKMLMVNRSSGTLARASYSIRTTNSWAAMSLSGNGFAPADGQQPDQLDINTNASNGINFTVGSGSTTPVSVMQIKTGGMNVNGTVTVNGQPITGGGPWLPVNNPTFTGTMTGENYLNTGGIDSLIWDYGDGLQASVGLGYGNTTESSFLIGQGMRYNASSPNSWTRGGSAAYGPTDVGSIQMAGAATVITGDTGLTVNQNFTPTMLFSISPKAYTLIPPMGNVGIPVGATFNVPVNITETGSGGGLSSKIFFSPPSPASLTNSTGAFSVGPGNFIMSSQAYADNTTGNWVATGGTAILENMSTQSGNVAFYQDTGLTIGSVFTPTVTGALVFPGNNASGWQINNYNAGNAAAAMYQASNGYAVAQLEVTGQGFNANPAFGANTTILAGTVGPIDIVPYANNGVRFWGGVFIANITSSGDGFQGLELGGYGARFNANNGNSSLSVGNIYMTGGSYATGGISGAAFNNGSAWIADGGAGGGAALIQLQGVCVAMYNAGGMGYGTPVPWAEIYVNCGSGEEVTHINNLVSARIPTITSGVLSAGSRDSFGWITGITGGETTITFAEPFLGNSTCTLTPSSTPMIWFNASQSALSDTFVCYDPTTGNRCVDGQIVEYHCFGQGEQQAEQEARQRRAHVIK